MGDDSVEWPFPRRPRGEHRRLGGVSRLSLTAQAVLVSIVIGGTIATILVADRRLAAWLVSENGPVETVQGLLLAVALLMTTLRCRRLVAAGESAVAEVILAYGFLVLLSGELDVWRTLIGRNLTIRRILILPPAPFVRAILILTLMVAVSVAVAVYAFRHRRELGRWSLAALESDWGRLLIIGILIFAGTEVFERRLNRILPTVFPKTFLEEGLELIANSYFILALRGRARADVAGTPRGD